MKILLSIIIPVYNAVEYLQDCIDSLLAQMTSSVEIILVDDGSTDGSEKMCDRYARENSGISVIHQENKGVVNARINGVIVAKGSFITFVDADDIVEPGMVDYFVSESKDIDLVTSGVKQETKSKKIIDLKDAIEEKTFSNDEERDYVLSNMIRYRMQDVEGILPYCIAKRYKKELLLEVMKSLDPRIKYAEDRELVYRYVLKSQSIKIDHRAWYIYRYNDGSAIHSSNSHVLHDINYLYEALLPVFCEHPLSDILVRQLEAVISSRINMASSYMGFSPETQTVRYMFPFFNMLDGKRLVLYGAGVVGCNYMKQTQNCEDFSWVLWVDKKVRSERVYGIEYIPNTEYDYIVIAVKDKEIAGKIKKELCEFGISQECILWKAPIVLAE